MEEYQHVVVVMSIVLGLALTQLLKGIAQLYRTRTRVRLYWLHTCWIVLLAVFSLLLWWTYWNYRGIQNWTFLHFVLYLSPTIAFYFLTAIAIPDPAEGVASLRDYYYSSRPGYFGTLAVYGLLAGLTATVVRGVPVLHGSHLFRLGIVLLALVAMRSESERLHTVILAVFAVLLLGFVVGFQFRLG